MPACSNLDKPTHDAHLAAGIEPGAFAGLQAEKARRAKAPQIVYVRIDGLASSDQQSRDTIPALPLRSILESFTPAVDPDHHRGFFLNFFGSPYLETDFPGTLHRLQLEILKQTALHISIGAARTKVAAAVASRLDRPGGIFIVSPGTEATFFASLPIEALHGIGSISASDLRRRGIRTLAELRRVPLPALQSVYGEAIARQIWHHSRALDTPSALPTRWSVAAALNFFASLLEDKTPCGANPL